MRAEREAAASDLPPQAGELLLGRITRPRAMLLAAALLGAGAILIAVGRLWPFEFHDVVRYSHATIDFDNILQEITSWLGVALTVAGIFTLIYVWGADRFRVSIGRLMVVVALLAVLLAVVITLRQRERARREPGAVAAPSTGRH
jgi:succinate-acetate transporter protein